jgi:hypothetical protein
MKLIGLLRTVRCGAIPTAFLLGSALCLSGLLHATDTSTSDPHSVPAVDGGIGPCSLEFTVKDEAGAPVYDSKIRVHIPCGHFHKLDLEVGTNADGKARFTGLPNRAKQPWQFWVSKEDREGSAVFDPAQGCRAERAITISKTAASSSQP